IRDFHVTGVQTCALPILNLALQTQQDLTVDQAYQQFTQVAVQALRFRHELNVNQFGLDVEDLIDLSFGRAPRSGKSAAEIGEARSEERRVGKEWKREWVR